MTELGKPPASMFEKITSYDYFSKKHVNLPKIKLSTQETGREVNMIEAKLTKNAPTKKATLSTTSKKSAIPSKVLPEKKVAPLFQKRMNFKLQVNPQMGKMGNYKSSNGNDNFLSDVNCTYQLKDCDNDKTTNLESSKQNSLSRNKDLDEFGTNGPNIALNVNLALNMDSKDKPSETIDNGETSSAQCNMDTPSSLKVAVRLRPLSDSEKTTQGDGVIKEILMKDNRVVIPHKKDCFDFDYCFNSTNPELFKYGSQEMVYREMGEPLLDLAFKGYNTCLFAYGQSGSGKTYTMMGTNDNPGVIPRFINNLFKRINSTGSIEFIVNISFLEIYNEKIYDLLSDEFDMYNKNLRVREHPQTGPYVEDLTVYTVENYENAMELLQSGIGRRTTAHTESNEQSSRSHSIFNIILVQNKKMDLDQSSETSCISKVSLVDLAGSERANSETCKNNGRFREGTSINKSLLTLGKVITQLAEHHGSLKAAHIPYRDSVLTYLLKDSLGGNSRTSMIATISPGKAHLDETLSTLRYASTAQKIVNIVHVNEDPKLKIINSLLKQISFLKKEVDKNKTENSFEQTEIIEEETIDKKCAVCSEVVVKNMQKLKDNFQELLDNQKSLSDSFDQFKENTSQSKHYEMEVPSFNSNIIDELKSLLKSSKQDILLSDTFNYESLMKEMEIDDEESNQHEDHHDDKKGKGKNKQKNDKNTFEVEETKNDKDTFKEVKGKGKQNKQQKKNQKTETVDEEESSFLKEEVQKEETPANDTIEKEPEPEPEPEPDNWASNTKKSKRDKKNKNKKEKEIEVKAPQAKEGEIQKENDKTAEAADESVNEYEDAQEKLDTKDDDESKENKESTEEADSKTGQVAESSASAFAKEEDKKDEQKDDDDDDDRSGGKKGKKSKKQEKKLAKQQGKKGKK